MVSALSSRCCCCIGVTSNVNLSHWQARLRKEADDRIADLGVVDPMLVEAEALLEKVNLEKLNDHGKVRFFVRAGWL